MIESTSLVREVSNLSWPTAPYSTVHRPVQRPTLLMTGLVVTPLGWAAVHLPVHRTRTLELAHARLGVHAVAIEGIAGVDALDRLLTAARRQAVAIAGYNLNEGLNWAAHRLAAAGASCPGTSTLIPEWLDAPVAPARPSAGRAQLLEMAEMALPPAVADLLAQAKGLSARAEASPAVQLACLVTRAGAVVIAAAAVTGRYSLPDGFGIPDVTHLLNQAAGDLLPLSPRDPAISNASGWPTEACPQTGEENTR